MRLLLSLAIVALVGNPAFAVATSWTNPKGGGWSNPANWSAGVPNANVAASLPELGAPYTVTLTRAAAAQSIEIHSHAGATIAGSGSLLAVSGDVVVADASGAALEIDGVQANVSGTIRVGTAGGAGALTIGDGSFVAGNVAIGDHASGTCVVSATGALSIPAILSIADGAGSNGSMTVHGDVSGPQGFALVGQGGSASATVDGSGAAWHQIGQLIVGSGGAGTVSVDHGGELTANGALIGSAGGSGSITLRHGATVTTGATSLGAAGISALIDIADAGSLWTANGAVACSGTTPNTLRVTWPGRADLQQLTLADASTIDIVAVPDMEAPITCPLFTFNGTLHAAPMRGYVPPVGTFVPVVSFEPWPMTFFDDVDSPEAFGQGWIPQVEVSNPLVYGLIVNNPIVALSVNPPVGIPVGFSAPLTYTATHIDGTIGISSALPPGGTWTSSDSSIATIGSPLPGINGVLLNALTVGTTTITARIGTVSGSADATTVATIPTGVSLASASATGAIGNQDSGAIGQYGQSLPLSANGRWTAFVSKASNLVADDTNNKSDVFVKDTVTGVIERIVPETPGINEGSGFPALSADGRFVAFFADAGFDADAPTQQGAFVWDRLTGDIEAVSVGFDGSPMNDTSSFSPPVVSGDGRYVAFASASSNLVPGDVTGTPDVFIRDRAKGTTMRIEGLDGAPNGSSGEPAISADGNTIVFVSTASNLVEGDTSGKLDVFAWTRGKGIERISVAGDGREADGISDIASVNADGSIVAFRSQATLVPGAEEWSAYVRNRATGELRLLELHIPGLDDELYPAKPEISGNGRFVVVTVGHTSEQQGWNVVRVDLAHDTAELVSATWEEQPAGFAAYYCGTDFGGTTAAFASLSGEVVGFDDNQRNDVFYRRMSGAGDLNGDGTVGSADLAILLGAWGSAGGAADLDRDDVVGASDVAILLGLWSQ